GVATRSGISQLRLISISIFLLAPCLGFPPWIGTADVACPAHETPPITGSYCTKNASKHEAYDTSRIDPSWRIARPTDHWQAFGPHAGRRHGTIAISTPIRCDVPPISSAIRLRQQRKGRGW